MAERYQVEGLFGRTWHGGDWNTAISREMLDLQRVNRGLKERSAKLEAALSGLLEALGNGETGDDCTEWCVACKIAKDSTPEYRAWLEGIKARSLGADAEAPEYPEGVPHRPDGCPIVNAREALNG